jgi:AcrR family transcriptional regulator
VTGLASPVSTRERLLAAARELMEEGGYAAASVAAIADRAGLASGTLYRHFASKEELFVEVFRSACRREERAMQAAVARAGEAAPAAQRLQAVLTTFARRALRAEPVDPRVDAERIAYRARYTELIADGLAAGIRAGELPAQDVRLTAAALVGGCGEALVGPLSSPAVDAPTADRLVESLRTFIGRAVGAP